MALVICISLLRNAKQNRLSHASKRGPNQCEGNIVILLHVKRLLLSLYTFLRSCCSPIKDVSMYCVFITSTEIMSSKCDFDRIKRD